MTFIAGVLSSAGDAAALGAGMLERYGRTSASSRLISPSPDIAVGLSATHDLPEDIFDRQPYSNDRYVLVGDIRVDNRDELAAKLGIAAADLSQVADSELFWSAWNAWQKDCVRQVIGGFAVAVWDKKDRELCLLRDHSGERPIYYAGDARIFAFASMPRAIRGMQSLDTSLNEVHMLNYLAIGPSGGSATFFKNIHLLPPGHSLRFKGGVKVDRYWHPVDAPAIRLKSNDDYVDGLRECLDAAVKARLRTVGKVGSHLSGGMDSSSVTATAARLLGTTRLTAFTAVPQAAFTNLGPVGRFGDEGPAAALVAAMYPNIDHVLIEPSGEDLFRVLQEGSSSTECPVFNPTNQMWMNAILDEARNRGIKVILSGSCGNATVSFGGLIGLSELFRSGRWIELTRLVRKLRSRGHTSWRGAAYWSAGYALPLAVRRLLRPELKSFDFSFSPVHPERAREYKLVDLALREFCAADKNSADQRRKMFDFFDGGFWGGGVSVGWDISLRDPMQDKRVFEFCYGIPIEQYLVEGRSRSMARRAMRDRVPAEILDCTTRGLQAADWYLTLGQRRKQMAEELKLIAQSPTACRLLDIERLQMLLDTWPESGYEKTEVHTSYHLALGRGLAAGNFIRHAESGS